MRILSLSNYAQENKQYGALLMSSKRRCGISLAVGYIECTSLSKSAESETTSYPNRSCPYL